MRNISAILIFSASLIVGFLFGFRDFFSQPQQAMFHLPYGKNFIERSLMSAPTVDISPDSKISAVIVNHHLLAPQLIVQGIRVIATQKPQTVVVVSPNHFGAGPASITSTRGLWDTPYGQLEIDNDAITALEKKGILAVYDEPFITEHGIFNILGFLKKIMPQTKIIPIIIKDGTPDTEVDALAQALHELPGTTRLIASLDFSHYLPPHVARFHDIKAIATIRNFDVEGAKSVEIDSKPTLRLAMRFAQLRGSQGFHLIKNTNAAEVRGDSSAADTTSYIVGYFSEIVSEEDRRISLFVSPASEAPFKDVRSDERVQRFFDGADKLISFPVRVESFEVRGTKVAVVPLAEFGRIQELRAAGGVIIAVANQKISPSEARRAIDHGAALVIHDLGEATGPFIEMYDRKPIISLRKIALGIVINSSEIALHFFPLQVENGFLLPAHGKELGRLLSELSEKAVALDSQKEDIMDGVFTYDF